MSQPQHTYTLRKELGFGVELAMSQLGEPHEIQIENFKGQSLSVITTTDPLASLRARGLWSEFNVTPGVLTPVPLGVRKLAVEVTVVGSLSQPSPTVFHVPGFFRGAENARYYGVDRLTAPSAYAVALFDWDYEGILAQNTLVTTALAGVDAFGNTISDLAQGAGRVDDGTFMSLKPGYGWHLRQTSPPSPGNRIELIPNFDPTQDWTLEAWMNSGEDTGDGRTILFAQNDNIAAETEVVEYAFHANADAVQVEIDDENAVSIWSSGAVAIAAPGIDVWKHCAVTFDSANGQYNVFYDGNRIAQSPASTAATDPFDAVGHFNGTAADEGGWTETRLSRGIRYSGATYAVPAAPFTVSD